MEEDASESAAIRAAVRSAKKSSRPAKIGVPETDPRSRGKQKKRERNKSSNLVGRKARGIFEKEVGERQKNGGKDGGKARTPKSSMGKSRKKR